MVWHNPILTISELAKQTGYKAEWLSAKARIRDDPLPTIKRGRRETVIYSDFCEWLTRNYGVDGRLRGTECLDVMALANKQPNTKPRH
jgi:hypothetical protein